MMSDLDPKTVLNCSVSCFGIGGAVWSFTMLAGGFSLTGQLATDANPMGEGVLYLASFVMTGVVSIWFYCLSFAERIPIRAGIASLIGVLTLIAVSFILQLYQAVDGSQGEEIALSAQTEATNVWVEIDNTDREIVNAYKAKVDFYEALKSEEEATGRGERFRQSREEFNRLRETYGPSLGVPLGRAPSGQSLTDNMTSARAAISALRAKVVTYERFAREEGAALADYTARLDALVVRLDRVGGESGGWVDQRALVYKEIFRKLGEMVDGGGASDPAFTLSVIIALVPELIQVICALLLYVLRSNGPSILARRIHEATNAFSLRSRRKPGKTCKDGGCRSKINEKDRFSSRTDDY